MDAECRTGAFCSSAGICIRKTNDCGTCPAGQECSAGTCQPAAEPSVSVSPPAEGMVSEQLNTVTVAIAAAPGVPLGTLHVEIATDHALAQADVAPVAPGKNAVVLTGFTEKVEQAATLVATLEFTRFDGQPGKVSSVRVPASYDAKPPAVTITFPSGQGQVNGWFGPSGGDLEIRAALADAALVSGATLAFDVCTARVACSFKGAAVGSTSATAGTWAFKVPRSAQAPGSEAPLGFHVLAADRAGNQASQAGQLQIDARPPQVGAFAVASAGQAGEDGRKWFAGGQGQPPVEVTVALVDQGAGIDPATVSMQLVGADVDADPGPIAATFPTPPDGNAHFLIPASAVASREGRVRFSMSAKDKLGQAASLAPAEERAVWFDALPPKVSLAKVDYTASAPAWTAVCGQAQSGSFTCGRGPQSAPVAALRDDTVTATFDVIDCGVGLAGAAGPAPATWTATSGGHTRTGTVAVFTPVAGSCANGSTNPIHRYSFTLQLAGDLPSLDAPNLQGRVLVPLGSAGKDLLGHSASAAPAQGATGDGVLAISLVRWAQKFAGGALAAGAPLLFPLRTSGGRSVVVGTDAAGPANNVLAIKPDGSLDWQASVNAVGADLALGAAGLLYAATGASRTCNGASGQCGTVWLIAPPSSGGAATLRACDVDAAVFGTAPAVFPVSQGGEFAVAAPTSRASTADNLYAFHVSSNSCASVSTTLLTSPPPAETFAGVSQAGQSVFVADAGGFSSVGFTGSVFGVLPVNYDPAVKVAALAPPALRAEADVQANVPVYAGADQRVRRGPYQSPCGGLSAPCWIATWAGQAAGATSIAPVFDDKQVVASDGSGVVTSWDLATGTLLWQTGAPAGAAQGPASGPVLLQAASGGSPSKALVLDFAGRVRRLSPPTSGSLPAETVLLAAGQFEGGQTPMTPVVDVLGTGGVAYLTDGAGWLWALQIDDPPLPASKTAWPRPSRDSCNSRSGDTPCP